MNDDQFKQFMAVETAKLAMLTGINNALQGLAQKQGIKNTNHHWDAVRKDLKEGVSASTKAFADQPAE